MELLDAMFLASGAAGYGVLGALIRRLSDRTKVRLIIGWEAASLGAVEEELKAKDQELLKLRREVQCLREELSRLRMENESGELDLKALRSFIKASQGSHEDE